MDYLALLWPACSRKVIGELFATGRVRSGGRPVKATVETGTLETLDLAGGTPAELPHIPGTQSEPLGPRPSVLYEDDRLAVLNKPPGLTVLPAREADGESCLAFLIRRELAARDEKSPEAFIRYRVVHRLDRVTSGVLLFAKTAAVERRMGQEFERRRVRKEYRALLRGVVEPARIHVRYPLAAGRGGRVRAVPPATNGAKDASTVFEVVERFGGATLVRALPRTGRMHQIRVHAELIGHPLCGDSLYESGPSQPSPAAMRAAPFLHALAYELSSDWPTPRRFECPVPAAFEAALGELRGSNPRC